MPKQEGTLGSLGFGSRLHRSMPAICRWRPQRPDRDYDPQPGIRALSIAFLAHPFDHLPRHCRCLVAVLRDPLMSGAVYLEIRDGHGPTITRLHWPSQKARGRSGPASLYALMVRTSTTRGPACAFCRRFCFLASKSARMESCRSISAVSR